MSLWRRVGRTMLYPNEVVEKHFGEPTTTRNWNTILTLCEILQRADPAAVRATRAERRK